MKSQVSFKFDGNHNIKYVVDILKQLNGMVYYLENLSNYVYRIYVASKEDIIKTFNVCFGIQSYCVYDDTKMI